MSLSLLQYNILSLALLLPMILNLFMWQNSYVAHVFGGVFFLFQCFVLGQRFAPGRTLVRQTLFGALGALILLQITSTFVYILWNLALPAQAVAWFLFLLACNLFIFARPQEQRRLELHEFKWKHLSFDRITAALIIFYLIFALSALILLVNAQVSTAIRSPWEVVPAAFWGLYFVASFVLWVLLWFYKPREGSLPLVSLHLFLSFGVAVIVYKLGYGYDSFIHQTSEYIIDSVGILLPKTPYYLGQYSLVVSLHRLIGITIPLLDRLMVPMLAAISLPLLCSELLGKNHSSNKPGLTYSHWLALIFILVPFSSMVVTTPQALANLLFLWIIIGLFPLLLQQPVPWSMPHLTVVGVATLLIHPLTGIPACILLALAGFELLRPKLASRPGLLRFLWLQGLMISSVAIPFLLWLWSLQSGSPVALRAPGQGLSFAGLLSNLALPGLSGMMPAFPNQFSYGFAAHWPWLLMSCAMLVGVWLWARLKTSLLRVYMLTAFALLANAFIIAAFFTFPSVASYESSAYASRLVSLALWCLFPFVLLAALWLYRLPMLADKLVAGIIILSLAWLNTASVYASYPRHNTFERSRQFSTSAADFLAVRYINDQMKSDYVVLANQSVSAAAIASYGFRTYFPPPSGDAPIFYYPVPTASPLYAVYLRMVNEKPTREIAALAHELTGASTVYFVLNSYWDNAEELRKRALMEADASADIADGYLTIFTFRFPE